MMENTIFGAIITNRTGKTAVNAAMLGYKFAATQEQRSDISAKVKHWAALAENLLGSVYLYAKAAHDNAPLDDARNEVFGAYKLCLRYLKCEFDDDRAKLKPQESDLAVLVAIGTGTKWHKDYEAEEIRTSKDVVTVYRYLETGKREITPVSASMFRKGLEDFICDRIMEMAAKTPEQIAIEREVAKAINKARRAAKAKARAAAEQAAKMTREEAEQAAKEVREKVEQIKKEAREEAEQIKKEAREKAEQASKAETAPKPRGRKSKTSKAKADNAA